MPSVNDVEHGASEKTTHHNETHRHETMTPTSSTLDKDVAIQLVGERAQEIDHEVEKRVVRKIDLFLIPAMVIGYGLVYYDKAILGSAVLFGMTTDLSLSTTNTTTNPPTINTTRLSWATSLFYFGMLTGLYPMTLLLQRFNHNLILGTIVCFWSLICMLTATVSSYRGLFAQRFFLGFVESVIPTAFMVIVSGHYTQSEQALRQALWFSSTGLWTIIGGGLNYGFANIEGGRLRGWQYIYLLAGCLTLVFGVWCFFVPDSAASAWYLSPSERVVAVERLRRGQTGVRCQKIKTSQLKEAVLDVKIWLTAVMMASAYTVNGAVSGFGPLIVSTFGWTPLHAILWQFPLGGVCLVSILFTGYLSSRIANVRIVLLVGHCLPVIAGCAMIWKSEWSRRAALPVAGYSIIGTFGAVVSLVIVLGMGNVAGATKKSAMAAAVFVAYCVGNIVGPLLIKSETKGEHYPELWTGLIICYCITIVAAVALYVVLWRENKRRDALPVDEAERDRLAFEDLTDKENPYFRYVL